MARLLCRSLFLIMLLFSVYSCSFKGKERAVIFSTSEDIEWVQQCIVSYPELEMLADLNVKKTERDYANPNDSFSMQIYGKNFVEFDRAITILFCLKWIIDGSDKAYERFTNKQPRAIKLTREHFDELHQLGMELLTTNRKGLSKNKMAQTMEAALILSKLGKSEVTRDKFAKYGANHPDQELFFEQMIAKALEKPGLLPTFDKLTDSAKSLLLSSVNLAHYGHMSHIEGGPEMFKEIATKKIPTKDPETFLFDFFIHLCRVAGAKGHSNPYSSLEMTDSVYKVLSLGKKAILAMKKGKDPASMQWLGYNFLVETRAKWLGLSPSKRKDRALARIGAMLCLTEPEDGQLLRTAFSKLDKPIQKIVIDIFDLQEGDSYPQTPTYIPEMLVNLWQHQELGSTRQERMIAAFALGLPAIVQVFDRYQNKIKQKKIDSSIPLNFNPLADAVKQNPWILLKRLSLDDKTGKILF
jgi:hypothetical protein